MSKKDGGSSGGRAWHGYMAAIAVGAAVLILLRVRVIALHDSLRTPPGVCTSCDAVLMPMHRWCTARRIPC